MWSSACRFIVVILCYTRPMDSKKTWRLIKKRRLELADFLSTLTAEQWNEPSLCSGWRVRDVVAHLVLHSRYNRKESSLKLLRHKLNLNKFLYSSARQLGRRSSQELVIMLREDANKQIAPLMAKPVNMLADLLIHEQDIRIALQKEKDLDLKAVALVLEAYSTVGYGIGEKLVGTRKTIRGLRMVATDIDWTSGESGIEVEGRGPRSADGHGWPSRDP